MLRPARPRAARASRTLLPLLPVLMAACGGAPPTVTAPLASTTAAVTDGTPPAPPSAPDGLIGKWEGTGHQGRSGSWAMLVEIRTTEPGLCGTVEYPTIPCSAQWTCERLADGTLEAREHIVPRTDRCVDNGAMSMRLSPDGKLDWRWAGAGDTAKALLTRVP